MLNLKLTRGRRLKEEAACPELPRAIYPGASGAKLKRSPPKYEHIGSCWTVPNMMTKAVRKREEKESRIRRRETWKIIS